MEQFYISSYIKFIWVIISHNSTSTSTSTQQSFKSFQQFNTKYGEFLQKLILDSQLSATNLMISLYYLYKHYHTNNVLLHDYCFDVLDEEDEEEEDNELFNSMLIYNVIISLVLSNKSFDDQSFTLKTWLIIIDSTLNTTTITNNKPLINIDLKLLNYLENYFLSSLNFKLSFLDIAINPKFWKILSNSKIFSINQTILNKFKQLVMITNPTNIPTTTNTTTNQVTNVINNINLVFSPLPSTPISSSMTMLATTYNGINNNYKVVANSNTTITPFTNYSLTPAVVHVRDHIQGYSHSHTHSHARSISSNNNNNNNFSSPLNNISTFSSPLNHPSTPSTPYYDDNYHVCLKRRRIMGAGSSGQVQPHYYLPPHPQPQQPMVLLPSQEFTFSQPMQYQYPPLPLPLPQPQQQHLDPMPVQAPVSMQSISSISSFTQNSGSSNSNNSLINGMSIGMNSTSVVTTAASTVATADVQQQQQQHQQPMMMPYYPLQPQANSQQFNLF